MLDSLLIVAGFIVFLVAWWALLMLGTLVAAWIRDLRGRLPYSVNGPKLASVTAGSRRPNVAWRWYQIREDVREMRQATPKAVKAGTLIVLLLALVVAVAAMFLLGQWHLSVPTAIIIGAIIIANAVNSKK